MACKILNLISFTLQRYIETILAKYLSQQKSIKPISKTYFSFFFLVLTNDES